MQEHSIYISVVVCVLTIILSFAASAFLSMFSFAVASFKFSAISESKKSENIDATAKRLLYASDKISSIVHIARRFALILSICALFCLFETACSDLLVGTSLLKKLICFIPIAIVVMWLDFVLLDITAIKIGKNKAEQVLINCSKLFYSIYILMMPIYFLSKAINKKLAKKLKIKENVDFENIDVELMLSAKENDTGKISSYTGKIVRNALKLQELDVSDVMLPRSKVDYFDLENSNEENLDLARKTHHTRYPICKGNLDDCYGIIHLKDIFINSQPPEDTDFLKMRRETLRIKENEKLESALIKLLKYKLQMAIVEDEFGGVIGVITLDAALSELVGQIKDEFSTTSQESVRRIGKNKYKILGSATLHKVEDFLDVDFDTDEASTFGGLITYMLGRFPEENEQVYFKEQRILATIDKIDERSVSECTVLIEEKEENE